MATIFGYDGSRNAGAQGERGPRGLPGRGIQNIAFLDETDELEITYTDNTTQDIPFPGVSLDMGPADNPHMIQCLDAGSTTIFNVDTSTGTVSTKALNTTGDVDITGNLTATGSITGASLSAGSGAITGGSISASSGTISGDLALTGKLGSSGSPASVVYASAVYTSGVSGGSGPVQIYSPVNVEIDAPAVVKTNGVSIFEDTSNNRALRVDHNTKKVDTMNNVLDDGSGNATVAGTLGVSGVLTASSDANITGNSTIGGTLGTTGLFTASGGVNVPSLTINRVLISSGARNIVSSSITTTTLGYLDATSSIQTQLNSKIGSSVSTDFLPSTTKTYNLGDQFHVWKQVHTDYVGSVDTGALVLETYNSGGTSTITFKANASNVAKIDATGVYSATTKTTPLGSTSVLWNGVYSTSLNSGSNDLAVITGSLNTVFVKAGTTQVASFSSAGSYFSLPVLMATTTTAYNSQVFGSGNSYSILYSQFYNGSVYDTINLGSNFYKDSSGTSIIPNSGYQTSNLQITSSSLNPSVRFQFGAVNTAPTDRIIIDSATAGGSEYGVSSTDNLRLNCASGKIIKLCQAGTSIVQVDSNIYPATNASTSLGLASNRWSVLCTNNININGQISGDLLPSATATYKLGDAGSSKVWNAVYSNNFYANSASGSSSAGNGYFTFSDRRKKQEIEPLDLGLDFVDKLQPVSYEYIGNTSGTKQLGLIAQDVQEALASSTALETGMIHEIDDGTGDTRLVLAYSELIAPMIKAIQELSAKVSAQEARIQELEDLIN